MCCFNGQQGYDKAFAIRWLPLVDDNTKPQEDDGNAAASRLLKTTLRFPLAELGDGENVALKVCVVFSSWRVDTEVDVALE